MNAHLVLVGLPGAGKSSVGSGLAARLKARFVDLDREITRRTGRTPHMIITDDGEEAFRQLEFDTTAELVTLEPAVVAPGGGWVTRPRTVALIRPPAKLVHLRVSPDVALRRLGSGIVARPLLDGSDPRAVLMALAEARESFYGSADWVVDTEAITVQEVIHMLVELVSQVR